MFVATKTSKSPKISKDQAKVLISIVQGKPWNTVTRELACHGCDKFVHNNRLIFFKSNNYLDYDYIYSYCGNLSLLDDQVCESRNADIQIFNESNPQYYNSNDPVKIFATQIHDYIKFLEEMSS